MHKINLYRYEDENGIITITPNARDEADIPSRLRLIAEEEMLLTDGSIETSVVDITFEEVGNWEEIADMRVRSIKETGGEADVG